MTARGIETRVPALLRSREAAARSWALVAVCRVGEATGGVPAEHGRGRLASLDALRGLAVLLMIEQHVTYWLCADVPRQQLLAVSALGGLAAPLFVVLAGIGATLSAQRKEASDRMLALRGLGVMGFGYLLNLLAPSWFTPGSWYVLHMIGFGLCLAPLARRLSSPAVGVAIGLVLVATVLVQNGLETPFLMTNAHMSDPGGIGGVLRDALVEGYFPILPWTAFLLAGVLAGRWIGPERRGRLVLLAMGLLAASALLAAIWFAGPELARYPELQRFFRVTSSFYPSHTPMSLFLMGCALVLLRAFLALESRHRFRDANPLVCMGRVSLTVLIVHIVVIRESAVRLDLWRTLGAGETLLVNASVLVLVGLLARWWRRADFRFGAEWTLRRITG